MKEKSSIRKYIIGILLAVVGYLGGGMIGEISGKAMSSMSLSAGSVEKNTNEILTELFESDDYLDQMKDTVANGLESESGVDRTVAQEYAVAYYEVVRKVKYTVMEPMEVSENRYAVTIHYEPIINPLSSEDFEKEFDERIEAVALDASDETEYYTKAYSILTDILKEYSNNPSYGKENSFIIYYEKQTDGAYGFSYDDIVKVGTKLFSLIDE